MYADVANARHLSDRTKVVARLLAGAGERGVDRWLGDGIGAGDLNGDGISDVLVGAPNAGGASCASTGAAHVYISNATTPTSPTGYLLQSPALEAGWNAYAWGVTAVSATPNHPGYLLVGEPGRDISGVTGAGQMYVYRVCSTTFPCTP